MRKLLFHRGQLWAAAGAASLALSACGGSSDSPASGALPMAQTTAQATNAAAGRPAEVGQLVEDKVLAADAGAASQEPQ